MTAAQELEIAIADAMVNHQDKVVQAVVAALPEPKYNRAMLAEVCMADPTGLAWLLDGIEYRAHSPLPQGNGQYAYFSEPLDGSGVPRLGHHYDGPCYGRVDIV